MANGRWQMAKAGMRRMGILGVMVGVVLLANATVQEEPLVCEMGNFEVVIDLRSGEVTGYLNGVETNIFVGD